MKYIIIIIIIGFISSQGCSKDDDSVRPSSGACSSVTCGEKTQSGGFCKNKTKNCSGKCYLHD